jgi:hypothetical protein
MAAIIFLNGASSAGKTSLGKALQDVSNEPYLLLGWMPFFTLSPRVGLEDRQAHIGILGSTTLIFHLRTATPFWVLAMVPWDGGSWLDFIRQLLH